MVTTSLLTVGFQEIHPLSQQGRIFTMLLAVLGVGKALKPRGRLRKSSSMASSSATG